MSLCFWRCEPLAPVDWRQELHKPHQRVPGDLSVSVCFADGRVFIQSWCWDPDFGYRRPSRKICPQAETSRTEGLGIRCWDPNLSGGYQNCGLGTHCREMIPRESRKILESWCHRKSSLPDNSYSWSVCAPHEFSLVRTYGPHWSRCISAQMLKLPYLQSVWFHSMQLDMFYFNFVCKVEMWFSSLACTSSCCCVQFEHAYVQLQFYHPTIDFYQMNSENHFPIRQPETLQEMTLRKSFFGSESVAHPLPDRFLPDFYSLSNEFWVADGAIERHTSQRWFGTTW